MSQSEMILHYLSKGRSITPLEALDLFGCFRLGARIHDLKAAGHPIVSHMVKDDVTGKRYARYALKAGE